MPELPDPIITTFALFDCARACYSLIIAPIYQE